MPGSRRTKDEPASSIQSQRVSRRAFVRDVTVLSAAVLAGTGILEGCSLSTADRPTAQTALSPTSSTVATVESCSAPLSEALRKRKSTNAFKPDALPKETVIDLLWAAWGINRPDSGKRTAPSAMNAQEIDIYVLLADGAHVYDAKANALTQVSDQDLRAKSGSGRFDGAPVHLIFVADNAKLEGPGDDAQKALWSAANTGFIGQNVYLYCAAAGLGAHFYASVDKGAMKAGLKLRDDQAVMFGQAVGIPSE
jgi:nitroreductase